MKISKIQIFANAAGLLPGIWIGFRLISGSLSANPIQTATIITGRTAILSILISLYCSPIHNILKMSAFLRLRKTAGLYGFFYALIHFLIFAVVDYQANLEWIIPEFKQKPFLQIGFIALLLLLPLAITSVKSIRTKAGKWWKWLHSLIYGITILILIHAAIASKGDILDPITMIAFYLVAMILRIPPLNRLTLKSIPPKLRKINTYLIS